MPAIPAAEATMEITALAKDCLTSLAMEGCTQKTLDEYDRIYRQFVAYVLKMGGRNDLREFDGPRCEGWVKDMFELGIHPNTIRHKISALGTLAKHGMRAKDPKGRPRLTENPVLTFKWPKKVHPRQEFLYPAELAALLALELRPHESAARDLFCDTGLRVSELCRANAEDFVKLGDGWALYVSVKGHGRQEQRVPVPISREVATGVREYLHARPVPIVSPVPLLVSQAHTRWTRTGVAQLFVRLGKMAGITRITISPHKLRRTSNVVARFADLDSLTRSKLLNHLNPSTIAHYDAIIPGELAAAREKARVIGLARYLGPNAIGNDAIVTGDSEGRANGS